MTLAEYIAELEKRAMWHRQTANQFASNGGEVGVWGALIQDSAVLAYEKAALLARNVENDKGTGAVGPAGQDHRGEA